MGPVGQSPHRSKMVRPFKRAGPIKISYMYNESACLFNKVEQVVYDVTVEVDVGIVSWSVYNQKILKTALTIFLIFCMKVHHYKGKKTTRRFFRENSQFFFISNFVSKIEVFRTLLKNCSNDLAETSYLDSLDHYLQLSNWSHVQENSSWPFFWPFLAIFWPFSRIWRSENFAAKNFVGFLRFLARS